jgi:NhaA family Na+:H+ antiporter
VDEPSESGDEVVTEAAAPASGAILIAAAAVALVWANTPWASTYEHFWSTPVALSIGSWVARATFHQLVNDGLMTIFFFEVGLEIREELHDGELSTPRRAALPVLAALGGMVMPAAIFVALNPTGATSRAWGVPMATDIAFAVGVLALLGKRVPPPLRTLLLALAIVDDVGAILVIAFVFSTGLSMGGAALAGASVLGVLAMQRLGIRQPLAYVVPCFLLWAGLLEGGIHPTLAGVVAGLLTPATPSEGPVSGESPPSTRVRRALHPWVNLAIMPLFAFANAGIAFGAIDTAHPGVPALVLGIVLGLVVGKPLGIVLASWLGVRSRVAALPHGMPWRGVILVGLLGGIGFTMSLFMAPLALASPVLLSAAKLSVLSASVLAALCALAWGRFASSPGAASDASPK